MNKKKSTWLWWLAFFLLFFGGLIAFILSQQPAEPGVRTQINMTLAIAIVSAGICIICATADWWMRH